MKNHFKTALNDSKVLEKYKDKPYHMAVLKALASYADKGHKVKDCPVFVFMGQIE